MRVRVCVRGCNYDYDSGKPSFWRAFDKGEYDCTTTESRVKLSARLGDESSGENVTRKSIPQHTMLTLTEQEPSEISHPSPFLLSLESS